MTLGAIAVDSSWWWPLGLPPGRLRRGRLRRGRQLRGRGGCLSFFFFSFMFFFFLIFSELTVADWLGGNDDVISKPDADNSGFVFQNDNVLSRSSAAFPPEPEDDAIRLAVGSKNLNAEKPAVSPARPANYNWAYSTLHSVASRRSSSSRSPSSVGGSNGRQSQETRSTQHQKTLLLIDADTTLTAPVGMGLEDDLAVLWALSSNQTRVLGLTTTHGNAPSFVTCIGGSTLVSMAKPGLPFACGGGFFSDFRQGKGAAGAVMARNRARHRSPVTMGVGKRAHRGSLVPDTDDTSELSHASTVLYQATINSERPVVWLALGSLTNIASTLYHHPDVIDNIERIVIMGGSLYNHHTNANQPELSLLADEEAANYVISAPIPKTIIPLEMATQATVTLADLDKLSQCIGAGGEDGTTEVQQQGGDTGTPGVGNTHQINEWLEEYLPRIRRHAWLMGYLNPLLYGRPTVQAPLHHRHDGLPDFPSFLDVDDANKKTKPRPYEHGFHPRDVVAAAYATDAENLFEEESCGCYEVNMDGPALNLKPAREAYLDDLLQEDEAVGGVEAEIKDRDEASSAPASRRSNKKGRKTELVAGQCSSPHHNDHRNHATVPTVLNVAEFKEQLIQRLCARQLDVTESGGIASANKGGRPFEGASANGKGEAAFEAPPPPLPLDIAKQVRRAAKSDVRRAGRIVVGCVAIAVVIINVFVGILAAVFIARRRLARGRYVVRSWRQRIGLLLVNPNLKFGRSSRWIADGGSAARGSAALAARAGVN